MENSRKKWNKIRNEIFTWFSVLHPRCALVPWFRLFLHWTCSWNFTSREMEMTAILYRMKFIDEHACQTLWVSVRVCVGVSVCACVWHPRMLQRVDANFGMWNDIAGFGSVEATIRLKATKPPHIQWFVWNSWNANAKPYQHQHRCINCVCSRERVAYIYYEMVVM